MKNKKLCEQIQVGDIFGDLTVLKVNLKDNSYIAECLCLCGKKHKASIYHLFDGNTTSCGCGLYRMREKGDKGYVTYNWAYQTYKRNAKKQKRSFKLSLEEFKKLVSLNCHYCDSEPKLTNRYLDRQGKQKRKNKKYQQSTIDMAYTKINGIDRIDNYLGYEKSNTISCCYICNRAKSSMSYRDFIQWINKLKLHAIKEIIDNA